MSSDLKREFCSHVGLSKQCNGKYVVVLVDKVELNKAWDVVDSAVDGDRL